MEIDELEPKIEVLEAELKELLIPKDPNDDKSCIHKSVRAQAVKPRCLQAIYGACTSASAIG